MKARRILHEFWCTITFTCPKCGEHLAYNDNDHEYGNWYCPNCDGNCKDEISIKEPTSDHWQEVRERAAMMALSSIIPMQKGLYSMCDAYKKYNDCAKEAISYADALVKELKGE